MNVIATLPENIHPEAGEVIQFQALVQANGTLLVTRIIHREPPAAKRSPAITLSEWARKWAGSMKLEPGETYDDLRRNAYQKKFGL